MLSFRVHPSDLLPGDHVCVRRYGMVYSHHGIYAGGGRVIHYTDVEGLLNKRRSRVVETSLGDFLGDGTLRRRRHARADAPEKILERARAALDEAGYNLVFNNCEHFASWCATGRRKSLQVRRAVATAASVAVVVAGAVFSRGGRRSGT